MTFSTAIPPIPVGICAITGHQLQFIPSHLPNGHAIVTGASGYGKSTMVTQTSSSLVQLRVPVISFDFHDDLELFGQRTWRIGDGSTGECSIRILQPTPRAITVFGARGFIEIAISAIDEMGGRKLGGAQCNVLRSIIPELLRRHGMLDVNYQSKGGYSGKGIVFSDLLALLEEQRSEAESHRERELFDGLINRIAPLASLDVFENERPLDIEDLLLNGGRIHMQAVPAPIRGTIARTLMRMLFSELAAMGPVKRQVNDVYSPFRVYFVIDEAGSVIRRKADDCIVKTIAKESRKFGVGLLLAAQTLDDLGDEVVANADTHFALPTKSARDARRVEQKLGISKGRLNDGASRWCGYYQVGLQVFKAYFFHR